MLWYSFFDPALRASILKDFLEDKFNLQNKIKISSNEKSHYYSFLKDKEIKEVFDKIFIT